MMKHLMVDQTLQIKKNSMIGQNAPDLHVEQNPIEGRIWSKHHSFLTTAVSLGLSMAAP